MPRVTDSHIHFFETRSYRYSWLDEPGMKDITRPFAPEDHLSLHEQGPVEVEASVHVHAEPDADTDQLALIRHLQDCHDRLGIPTAAIGWADLCAPSLDETLSELTQVNCFRGVRQHVFYPPVGERYPTQASRSDLMLDSDWRRGFTQLGKSGLSFDLLFWHNQLEQALDLLWSIPETTVIIEHALFPSIWADFATWQRAVRSLPVRENLFVKISAFGQMGPVSAEAVRPYAEELCDHFGTSQVMVASNYPVDRLFSTWSNLWSSYIGALSSLDVTERDNVLRLNAKRAYRLHS